MHGVSSLEQTLRHWLPRGRSESVIAADDSFPRARRSRRLEHPP